MSRLDTRARGGGGISPADLEAIITDPGAAQTLVREAEQLGKKLAKSLSTSQIRAIFGEVRAIEGEMQRDPSKAFRRLQLLKPKMSYRAGREEAVRDLVKVLDPAVDLVNGEPANFRRFVEFFESILAYHRAYGGK